MSGPGLQPWLPPGGGGSGSDLGQGLVTELLFGESWGGGGDGG